MRSTLFKSLIFVFIAMLVVIDCTLFVQKLSARHQTAKIPGRVRQAIAAADHVSLSLHLRQGDYSKTITDKFVLKAIADSVCVTKVRPVPHGMAPANRVFPLTVEIHGVDSFVVDFMVDDFNVYLEREPTGPQYICEVCDTQCFDVLLQAARFPDPFEEESTVGPPK